MAPVTDAELNRIFDFNSTGPPELALEFNRRMMTSLREELQQHPSAWYWTKDTRALFSAVKNQRQCVTEFLLGQGMRPTNPEARPVTQQRDLASLKPFLRHGWDINEADGLSNSSILEEVLRDDELLSFFLSHGADPNARGQYDDTPLSEAVRYAPFSTIKVLFDHGGTGHAGQLLHRAVYRTRPDTLEVMDFLLSKGVDINKIMYGNWEASYIANIFSHLGTPLHFAAALGSLELVRFLLDRGAHPLIEDSSGGIPLQVAEKGGHQEVAAYLRPITAGSLPAQHQFTRGQRMPGREKYYAPS